MLIFFTLSWSIFNWALLDVEFPHLFLRVSSPQPPLSPSLTFLIASLFIEFRPHTLLSCFSFVISISRFIIVNDMTSSIFSASRDCTTSHYISSILMFFATPSLHKLSISAFSCLISSFLVVLSLISLSRSCCNFAIFVVDSFYFLHFYTLQLSLECLKFDLFHYVISLIRFLHNVSRFFWRFLLAIFSKHTH